MADKRSFEQFFETELIPALRPLEEQRKELVKKNHHLLLRSGSSRTADRGAPVE
jgi:hypothetical protein